MEKRKTNQSVKMKTSVQLINSLKTKHSIKSDYGISKLLGVSRQNVSSWVNNKQSIGDQIAVLIADELGLDPFSIIASMQTERAIRANDSKAVIFWRVRAGGPTNDNLTPPSNTRTAGDKRAVA